MTASRPAYSTITDGSLDGSGYSGEPHKAPFKANHCRSIVWRLLGIWWDKREEHTCQENGRSPRPYANNTRRL